MYRSIGLVKRYNCNDHVVNRTRSWSEDARQVSAAILRLERIVFVQDGPMRVFTEDRRV